MSDSGKSMPLVIFLIALAIALSGGEAPPWFFSQVAMLDTWRLLASDSAFSSWGAAFHNFHALSVTESPLVFPISSLFVFVFGVSSYLPTLCGSVAFALTAMLIFVFAREQVNTKWAALVVLLFCLSPLQLTWARIGGVSYFASVHLLLLFIVAARAGRLGSPWYVGGTAFLTWGCLYHYYALRVGIPLGLGMFGIELARSKLPLGKKIAAGVSLAGLLVGIFLVLAQHGIAGTFWPNFHSYFGHRDVEIEIATGHEPSILRALSYTFKLYLLGRTHGEYSGPALVWPWVIPFVFLGLLALPRVKQGWIFLLIAVTGLMIPTLSEPSPRRLLIFDFGLLGLAAGGMSVFLSYFSGHGRAKRTIIVALAFATCHSIFYLNSTLRAQPLAYASIPWGQSGFGDVRSCIQCRETARRWIPQMRRNATVLLIDSNLDRENRAIPAGLSVFGELAAIESGNHLRFQQFYAIRDSRYPRAWGARLYPTTQSAAEYLAAQLRSSDSRELVLHFETPTAWERSLLERLKPFGDLNEVDSGFQIFIERGKFDLVIPELFPKTLANTRTIEPQEISWNSYSLVPWKIALNGERAEVVEGVTSVERENLVDPHCKVYVAGDTISVNSVAGEARRYGERLSFRANNSNSLREITGAIAASDTKLWVSTEGAKLSLIEMKGEVPKALRSISVRIPPVVEWRRGECTKLASGKLPSPSGSERSWLALTDPGAKRTLVVDSDGERLGEIDWRTVLGVENPTILHTVGSGEFLAVSLLLDRSVRVFSLSNFQRDDRARMDSATGECFGLNRGIPVGGKFELDGIEAKVIKQGAYPTRLCRSVVGEVIRMGGKAELTGIGVHAESQLLINLAGRGRSKISGRVGISGNLSSVYPSSIEFMVRRGDTTLWSSGVVRSGEDPKAFEVDISGLDDIDLVATSGGDGAAFDQGIWGGLSIR